MVHGLGQIFGDSVMSSHFSWVDLNFLFRGFIIMLVVKLQL